LNADEQKEFRESARREFIPNVDEISELWHPIYRDECQKMIEEANKGVEDSYHRLLEHLSAARNEINNIRITEVDRVEFKAMLDEIVSEVTKATFF